MAKCAPRSKSRRSKRRSTRRVARKAISKRRSRSTSKGRGGKGCRTGKRKGHPANCFILYFLATWRKCGGNMYTVAQECGKKWKGLPETEKQKYKNQYCKKCRNCKSCKRPTGGKAKRGKKC